MPAIDGQSERRLRVFLCHSSGDKALVRQLYEWLQRDGFDPWLDVKKLLPAQRWADVIEDAVRASDVVVVCLSQGSVSKEGFLQREIKFALQIADEKPDDTMYILPARLEPVELPRRFRDLQAADLYEADGYERLKQALAQRAAQIEAASPKPSSGPRLLNLPIEAQSSGKPGKVPRGVQWFMSHPRLIALGLLLIVGGISVGGYGLYQKQIRQRALAEKFYSDGVASWKALDLRNAEDLLSQAAAAEPSDPKILAAYSLSLNERGRELEAREVAKKAWNLASSLPRDLRSFVQAVYDETNANWSQAGELYSALWRDGGHDLENGLRLAHVETLGGAPRTALDTLQAISSTKGGDPRIVLEKAAAQSSLGQFEEELQTLTELIDGHPARDLVRATALAARCWVQYNRRDNNDSLESGLEDCNVAEGIFNDGEDALGRARTLSREALILAAQGGKNHDVQKADALYKEALDKQNRAIDIAHERGAIRDEAGGHLNLGDILMEKTSPDSEAARNHYEISRKLFRSLGDKASLGDLENDAAVRQIQLCNYREALGSAETAQQAWNEIGSADEAFALSNMGSMQLYLGDDRDAEKSMKSALSKAQGKLSVDTDDWLITLGEIYTEEAKVDLADQCFKGGPCYDDRQPSNVHGDRVLPDAILDDANLKIEQGRISEAVTLAANDLKLAQSEKDHDEEIEARSVLVNALLTEGSGSALNRARSIASSIDPFAVKDCRLGVALHLTLARIAGRSGDTTKHDEELHQVVQTAGDLGLTRYTLEATLEQAEMDLKSHQNTVALQLANQVLSQSSDHGLLLVRAKALDLVQRAGTHKNTQF